MNTVTGGFAWCAWCRGRRLVVAELIIRGRLFDVWRYTCAECGRQVYPEKEEKP